MSQIEQLRKQFDGYNNTQKKQFIDNLKAKLQTNKNPEYSRFLNECVSKYNASLRGGGLSNDDFSDLLDGSQNNLGTGKTAFENRIEHYKANGYTFRSNNGNEALLDSYEVADKALKAEVNSLKRISSVFWFVGFIPAVIIWLFITSSWFVVVPIYFIGGSIPAFYFSYKANNLMFVHIKIDKTGKITETGNVLNK